MGAGSVPTHRKTSGALYHRLPAGNMPRRDKFHAHATRFPRTRRPPPRPGTLDASRRDLPVFSLKNPPPAVHIAGGHPEQAPWAPPALVTDPVALRQCELVVPLHPAVVDAGLRS